MPVLQIYTSPPRGIWKITETFPELMDLFHPKDEELLAYIYNIKSEARKKEYVAVRLLLRHLLEKEVQILYNIDGSPYLTDTEYFISITHTKGYAAVILSEESRPGIDIESRSERALALKERFLSKEESDLMCEKKSISSADFATVFWCAKETAFKSLKCESVDFIKHLHILSCSVEDNSGTLIMSETKTAKKQFLMMDFEITDDYVLIWKG
jgi:phosphopantetheinyl transferase